MRSGRMLLAALLAALAGCDRSDINDYSCLIPDKGHLDADRRPDPCHLRDPDAGAPADAGPQSDAGDTCAGECVPIITNPWGGPALLWTGAEADAPACSSLPIPLVEGYAGYGQLVHPPMCGACSCMDPTGSCALPATLTASSKLCPGDGSGAVHTSFDPPASWGGTCTTANAIPAGQLCAGGVPCVQSVTIAPLTLIESCESTGPSGEPTPATWGTFARVCFGKVLPTLCQAGSTTCVTAAPGPEFTQCVYKEGSVDDPEYPACPPGYPVRSTFYDGYAHATCSPCACDAPKGSTCSGSISLFKDPACGKPLLGPVIPIDATGSKCHDVPPGSPLLSKTADAPSYHQGTCAANGGVLSVQAAPSRPMTFCCQSTP